jgi:hypothetical protein
MGAGRMVVNVSSILDLWLLPELLHALLPGSALPLPAPLPPAASPAAQPRL